MHQCVDSAHFEKIAAVTTSKEAWDILAKACSGDEKLKKVKLKTLKRHYELLQMENNERVCDYFTRLLRTKCRNVVKNPKIKIWSRR